VTHSDLGRVDERLSLTTKLPRMRLVVSDFMSLDGVVQAPGHEREDLDGDFRHGGWSMPYFDPDTMGPAFDETIDAAGALLFGRRTYETMAGAWPERAGDPFADKMNAIKKYVASRTFRESDVTWHNATLLGGETAIGDVRRLKGEPGGDIVVMGSAALARQLIAEGLVDEYLLMIEPILLGGGKRLFPDDTWARPLELVSVATAATGVLLCRYRPG
jgi:dihydrofolate reductase